MAHEIATNPLPGVEQRSDTRHFGIFDHGAHVWAWQPDGAEPVVWMSSQSMFDAGQPVRGGVPLCFPWFGPGRTGELHPGHGFARLNSWRRIDDASTHDGGLRVEYHLDAGLATDPQWPHRYDARMTATFGDTELLLEFTVTNTGDEEISYEAALHTYLAVGDVREVSVAGLDGARYLDKVGGGTATQSGDLTITGETDRIYFSTGEVELVDPVLRRRLVIGKENSANTVVWNPWVEKAAAMPDFGDAEWTSMICIEAVNALDDAVVLAPGAAHTMTQRITLVQADPDAA